MSRDTLILPDYRSYVEGEQSFCLFCALKHGISSREFQRRRPCTAERTMGTPGIAGPCVPVTRAWLFEYGPPNSYDSPDGNNVARWQTPEAEL